MDDGVNYRLWKKCIFVLDISFGLACGLDRRDKPGNYLYRTSRSKAAKWGGLISRILVLGGLFRG